MDYLKIPVLEHGRVYKLQSRNLKHGVWVRQQKGFIGIRTKFNARFLATEFHWDCESFATAKPIEAMMVVPDGIPLVERLPTKCNNCGVLVTWNENQRRWEHDKDNLTFCGDIDPISPMNTKLFEFLDGINETSKDKS